MGTSGAAAELEGARIVAFPLRGEWMAAHTPADRIPSHGTEAVPAIYGMMGGMEKTTVYLTTEQKAALTRAAEAEGRSEARLIRAGIDLVTARHRAGEVVPALGEHLPDGPREPASLDRPRWIDREGFVRLVLRGQADAGLRAELRELAPGTTDDEPIP